MTKPISTRSSLIQHGLAGQHFRYRPERHEASPPSVQLPKSARFEYGFEPGPIFEFGRGQFTRFLSTCLGCEVEPDAAFEFRFNLDASLPPAGFQAVIEAGSATIQAANENGLVDAMHYMERELADHGGAFPSAAIARHPTLATRFTEAVFAPGHHGVQEYSGDVLGLMQHFGSNALRRNIAMAEIWRSESLPELNAPNAEAEIERLQCDAKRLAKAGMRYFVILNAAALPGDHPLFVKHPELRGAREEIFLEETSGRGKHVLCSSQPAVLKAYEEVVSHLFRVAPALAGAIVLVGGEGFHHCFMRPQGEGLTNCPHCQPKDPHQQVANLVNKLAEAIQSANPSARLLAWPYGALTWSREDLTESRWIDALDSSVEVLSNFDCGDSNPHNDAKAVLFDYNILIPGPSSRFAAQAARCGKRGIPILAKTETNTTPDTFFLPHIPVHFRWYERFRSIREAGCTGYMGQWFFYGMNGSIPEELQYHSVWNPGRSAEELLATIAVRDFRLDRQAALEAVAAWKDLSAAWDSFPYSAMTSGEREAYMRGPWYLGPAHPLIFNEQSHYELASGFFARRGDLVESLSKSEIAALQGKPRYVCNLLFCLPFGVGKFLQLAQRCRDEWEAGVKRLTAACGPHPTEEARRELNVCHILACHLNTLVNTAEFLRLRDRLGQEACEPGVFEELTAQLRDVLNDEIANARRALPIVEEDPRIGYGHNYGTVYDAEMIRSKIRQCEFVRDKELPRIASIIRFHVWYRYP